MRRAVGASRRHVSWSAGRGLLGGGALSESTLLASGGARLLPLHPAHPISRGGGAGGTGAAVLKPSLLDSGPTGTHIDPSYVCVCLL